jgi:hypothetical protein
MEGDFNDIDGREDNIDREVRKLIKEVEDRERIRRPMIELLMMLNSDLDPWA